jgi:hypothetical protein
VTTIKLHWNQMGLLTRYDIFGAKEDAGMDLLGSTQKTEFTVENLPHDAKKFKFQVQYLSQGEGTHASEIIHVEKPSTGT